MWNEGWAETGSMGWSGVWHWMFSFHGILSIVSITIIVIIATALFRDWRRERTNDMNTKNMGHE